MFTLFFKMRMWMLNPKILCRNHLLGEHLEIHMFVSSINKGYKLNGYIENNLLEIDSLKKRHDQLATEMKRRGYYHKSPLQRIKKRKIKRIKINTKSSLRDLLKRCKECRKRYNETQRQRTSKRKD